MCSGWVPKTVLDKVDEYCRRFLWSRDGEGRGLVLAVWEKRGGRGIGFQAHEAIS